MSTITRKPFNTRISTLDEARHSLQQLDTTTSKLAGDVSTLATAIEGDITTVQGDITTINTSISNITSGSTVTSVSAADKASLPASSNGIMGFTTGGTKRGYMRIDGAWLCITHLES